MFKDVWKYLWNNNWHKAKSIFLVMILGFFWFFSFGMLGGDEKQQTSLQIVNIKRKFLIVYYSHSGTTTNLVQKIKRRIIEIHEDIKHNDIKSAAIKSKNIKPADIKHNMQIDNRIIETDIVVDIEQLKAPSLENSWFGNIKVALLALWEGDVKIDKPIYNASDYTDVIVCFPIWMGNVALPIQTYLKQFAHRIHGRLHLCATYGGSTENVLKQSLEHLSNVCGKYHSSYLLISAKDVTSNTAECKMKLNNFADELFIR